MSKTRLGFWFATWFGTGLSPVAPGTVATLATLPLNFGLLLLPPILYLAVILDAWSRRVVGYAVGPMLDARLPLAALAAAVAARQPSPGCIHHSDRGTQYASRRYRDALAAAGLRGSMSRPGNPYDNAHAESFMKTFKHEEALLMPYRNMDDLLTRIPLYLEHTYNHLRLHSALGYLPPSEFAAQHQRAIAAVKS